MKHSEITHIIVSLDEEVPEMMREIERIGGVQIEDFDGNREDDETLVDNTEFQSIEELKKHVAQHYGKSIDVVEIV